MPKSIKVKPRGAALFAVDDYFNVLGLVPRNRNYQSGVKYGEILDRRKFIVLTLNKQDEDPRGKSFYRPVFNWYNLKTQMPAEMLRYVIEETVPKAVLTMPPEQKPFEYVLNDDGEIVYNDPETRLSPKFVPAVQSYKAQLEGFKSGSGAIIPDGAKLEPFSKRSSAGDANVFNNLLAVIEKQMEDAMLLQSLAQSEGQHQARSASQTHKELLEAMAFWIRWIIAVMTINDICKNSVLWNYGPEYVKYLPFISLGDFVRRDWARDLEVLAKAYFQGFLDDQQRAELMAWLNLPRPGPSRQEIMAEADMNGEPVMPNQSRPDKQSGNKRRNDGNGTEKKDGNSDNTNKPSGFSPLHFLGHHGKRLVGHTGNIFSGRR